MESFGFGCFAMNDTFLYHLILTLVYLSSLPMAMLDLHNLKDSYDFFLACFHINKTGIHFVKFYSFTNGR